MKVTKFSPFTIDMLKLNFELQRQIKTVFSYSFYII